MFASCRNIEHPRLSAPERRISAHTAHEQPGLGVRLKPPEPRTVNLIGGTSRTGE